jgi:hypothetical protein
MSKRQEARRERKRALRPWLWCDWCSHARVRHVWVSMAYCCRDCSCTNYQLGAFVTQHPLTAPQGAIGTTTQHIGAQDEPMG